jgi:hypothetical protein
MAETTKPSAQPASAPTASGSHGGYSPKIIEKLITVDGITIKQVFTEDGTMLSTERV